MKYTYLWVFNSKMGKMRTPPRRGLPASGWFPKDLSLAVNRTTGLDMAFSNEVARRKARVLLDHVDEHFQTAKEKSP